MAVTGCAAFLKYAIFVVSGILCVAALAAIIAQGVLMAKKSDAVKDFTSKQLKSDVLKKMGVFQMLASAQFEKNPGKTRKMGFIIGMVFCSVVLILTGLSCFGAIAEKRGLLLTYVIICGILSGIFLICAFAPLFGKSAVDKQLDKFYEKIEKQNNSTVCNNMKQYAIERKWKCGVDCTIQTQSMAQSTNSTTSKQLKDCSGPLKKEIHKKDIYVGVFMGLLAVLTGISTALHAVLRCYIKSDAESEMPQSGPVIG